MVNNNLNTLPIHHFWMCSNSHLPFDIRPFNREEHSLAYSEEPHRHSFYQIIYIKRGEGINIIDLVAFPIKENSLYFISPGQVHRWGPGKVIEGLYIIFTEEFLLLNPLERDFLFELDFFHSLKGSPHLVLKKYHLRIIREIIHEIEIEAQTIEYARPAMIRALLRIMLIKIQRIFDEIKAQEDCPKRTSLVHNFQKLVSENFLKRRKISFYADMLNLNKGTLSENVKALTGLSPTQIIKNELLLEAKRLLAYTDLTVSEIAYKLDYEDPSYFGRVFRHGTGMSPNSFREGIQKKYQTFFK